jgi:hypothetical protein
MMLFVAVASNVPKKPNQNARRCSVQLNAATADAIKHPSMIKARTSSEPLYPVNVESHTAITVKTICSVDNLNLTMALPTHSVAEWLWPISFFL